MIGELYFFTDGGQRFSWHQDRESFYFTQTHHHDLNFCIPIVEPTIRQSNLSLIPADRLKQRSPERYEHLLGRGACLVEETRQKSIYCNENEGGTYGSVTYDRSEITVTPELQRGDLLFLRGHVLDRTQHTDTVHVALSMLFTQGSLAVLKTQMVDGGYKKFTKRLEMRNFYQSLFAYFDARGTDATPFNDFYSDVSSRFCNTCSGTRRSLRRYLIAEKLRQRFWRSLIAVGIGAIRAGVGRANRDGRRWFNKRTRGTRGGLRWLFSHSSRITEHRRLF